jgi:acyl-CoA synthetase (AMP-forming)/AMP-acid ligase II
VPRWIGRGPGNPEGVPRWIGRGPGNPEGVPRWIGLPDPGPGLDPAGAVGLLPYSSGTTGLPKGVLLTHANLVTSVRQVASGLRVGERDTVLAVAPFSHIMGFLVTLAVPLCAGATVGQAWGLTETCVG